MEAEVTIHVWMPRDNKSASATYRFADIGPRDPKDTHNAISMMRKLIRSFHGATLFDVEINALGYVRAVKSVNKTNLIPLLEGVNETLIESDF